MAYNFSQYYQSSNYNALAHRLGSIGYPLNHKEIDVVYRLVDVDGNGHLDERELGYACDLVSNWSIAFSRFDTHRSWSVQRAYICDMLLSIGYRISPATADGIAGNFCVYPNHIMYDEFIRLMCYLHKLIGNFRRMDSQGYGNVMANFEDLLYIFLDNPF